MFCGELQCAQLENCRGPLLHARHPGPLLVHARADAKTPSDLCFGCDSKQNFCLNQQATKMENHWAATQKLFHKNARMDHHQAAKPLNDPGRQQACDDRLVFAITNGRGYGLQQHFYNMCIWNSTDNVVNRSVEGHGDGLIANLLDGFLYLRACFPSGLPIRHGSVSFPKGS